MFSGSRAAFSHQLQFGFCCCGNNSTTINFRSNAVVRTKQVLQFSSLFLERPHHLSALFSPKRFRFLLNDNFTAGSSNSDDTGVSFTKCVQPTQSPVLSDCLNGSKNEDTQEPPSERLSPIAGGIVALGKFDALHIGHRELAIQASKVGFPFLLSFVGMAEVLGWEPRPPIVAKRDRKRVLASWGKYCGNLTPKEFHIEFSNVRYLPPRQFVEKLSLELGVRGVVAGENYRFGYKAAGDAKDLIKLCEEYGMSAYIISSVMDKNQLLQDINFNNTKERGQVSSTRVRLALAKGDMKYVSELLGRHHRVALMVKDDEMFVRDSKLSAPKSCLLNLPPAEGCYENCSLLTDEKKALPCKVIIDATHIHLELDKVATDSHFSPQDLHLSVEFGGGERY